MVELIAVLLLLILGFVFGLIGERRHDRSLREREAAYRELPVLAERLVPSEYEHHGSQLVTGSVVMSVDYFKALLAQLRNLVGGRMTVYETLLDRARREARLRMQAEAQELGAAVVLNLKYETSTVGSAAAQGIGSVEVLAYGTAMVPTGKASRRAARRQGADARTQ